MCLNGYFQRDRISPILKFMWRFSTSEIQLFCLLSTYIWLFSKYDEVRQVIISYSLMLYFVFCHNRIVLNSFLEILGCDYKFKFKCKIFT